MLPNRTSPASEKNSRAASSIYQWWLPAAAALYVTLFFAIRLPSLPRDAETGLTPRRAELLWALLLPDQVALNWLGERGPCFADRLAILAVFCGMWSIAVVTGSILLMAARAAPLLSRLERFVFAAAMGWSAWSSYILLVGLAGWLRGAAVYLVPGGIILVVYVLLSWRTRKGAIAVVFGSPAGACSKVLGKRGAGRAESRNARSSGPRPAQRATEARGGAPRSTGGRLEAWRALLGIFFMPLLAAVYVLGGILPPIEFDAREYHLQVPKEWYEAGGIDFLPHNVYGNMPMGAEVLALPAMALLGDWWRGALAGKAILASFALLAALCVLAAGSRFHNRRPGWLGALILLTTPWVSLVSMNGLIEMVWGCHGSLALYAAGVAAARSSFRPRRIWPLAALSGWLAGAAAACKYPSLLLFVLPVGLIWLFCGLRSMRQTVSDSGSRHRIFTSVLGCILLYASTCALAGGGWYVKNAILSGDPVYPLLNGVFLARSRTQETNDRWNRAHALGPYSLRAALLSLTSLLWRSEWLSPALIPLLAGTGCKAAASWFYSKKPWDTPSRGATRFPRRSWTLRRKRVPLGTCWVILFAGLALWWFFTHRIERFLVPCLPLASFLAGTAAARDGTRPAAARVTTAALVGIAVAYWFVLVCGGVVADARYLAPLDELRRDPRRVDPWHLYLNEQVPPDRRALLVGDAQPFDLDIGVIYNTVFDSSLLEELCGGKGPEDCRTALAAAGISHVYVHWGEIERYRSLGNYGFSEFVQPSWFDQLQHHGVLEPLPPKPPHPGRVYRVIPGDPSSARP